MISQTLAVMPIDAQSQRIWASTPPDQLAIKTNALPSVGTLAPTPTQNIPAMRDIVGKLNAFESRQERGLIAGLHSAQTGQNNSVASTMLRLQVDLVMYQTWHQIVTKTVESVNTSMKTLMNAA